ncbi:MAG: hypothetical protein LIP12_06365 [Clostridiales bacterium]|nr:hypothetical protein [Clostridiales bacterium]
MAVEEEESPSEPPDSPAPHPEQNSPQINIAQNNSNIWGRMHCFLYIIITSMFSDIEQYNRSLKKEKGKVVKKFAKKYRTPVRNHWRRNRKRKSLKQK